MFKCALCFCFLFNLNFNNQQPMFRIFARNWLQKVDVRFFGNGQSLLLLNDVSVSWIVWSGEVETEANKF